MSLIYSRSAYGDCYEVFDKAMEDQEGVRVKMPDYNAAVFFRMRMHQARKINRDDSKRIYDAQSPMFNASTYDKLVVRIKSDGDNWFVYVEHGGIDLGLIEPLSGVEALPEPEPRGQIEAPKEPLMIEHVRRRF